MMSDELVRWGDSAQYVSAPIKKEHGRIVPQATLLSATPDPLGTIAAACRMYEGLPTYSLSKITDEERMQYWEESFKSHLRAPHEFVQFHFFAEGVDRSFTHQMVRQRTATFAQESLRFAVKEDLANEIPLPPSIADGTDAAKVWTDIMFGIEEAYTKLVNAGIPAEDARGLLPHATTTRLHWRTNLNDLVHHAGNRLCTQAQFHWRVFMISLMQAIRSHSTIAVMSEDGKDDAHEIVSHGFRDDAWQFETIGQPNPRTFAPICYHTGKCEFRAIFDRPCVIRDRVDENARIGRSSEHWGVTYDRESNGDHVEAIQPEEWLLDPSAAR